MLRQDRQRAVDNALAQTKREMEAQFERQDRADTEDTRSKQERVTEEIRALECVLAQLRDERPDQLDAAIRKHVKQTTRTTGNRITSGHFQDVAVLLAEKQCLPLRIEMIQTTIAQLKESHE